MAAGWFSGVPRWLLGRLGSSGTTPPAPVAGFTGTPLSGTAPLTVAFTDTSIGTITSRQFSPGDGTGPFTSVPATHAYANSGQYSPSLTVTGPGGSDTLTRTDYITVTAPVVDPWTVNWNWTDETAVAWNWTDAPPLAWNWSDSSAVAWNWVDM